MPAIFKDKKGPIDFVELLAQTDIMWRFPELPIEEAVIRAYNITYEELAPYWDTKYWGTHWSRMLDEILIKRAERMKEEYNVHTV